MVGEKLSGDHKHRLEIVRTESCWYTSAFRPEKLPDPVEDALDINREPWNPKEFLAYGGVIIGEDQRQEIKDTDHPCWQVHGQLTMDFEGTTYTGSGTLISPWHVLTTGRNLYDPVKKVWACNIQFHPGRNGSKLLHAPAFGVKKAVFSGWEQGNKEWDMGILELSEDVGTQLGWNGLLCGEDSFLSKMDPVNLVGYPGDKPLGTMWYGLSHVDHVYENQFAYTTISACEGQNGANPWVVDLSFPNKDAYSLGVHAYGVSVGGKGVINIATRLTKSKLEAIVHLVNTLF